MSLETEPRTATRPAAFEEVTPTRRLDDYQRRGALGRRLLLAAVLGWFALLILVPTLALVRGAFASGLRPFWDAITSPDAQRAFRLTMGITLVATVVNTVFGLAFAVVLVRQRFWGKTLVD